MNKKLLLLIIALVLLIIILIVMGIFSFLNRSKIAEIKTFSEIPGFTFEYPVFKDWEINGIKKIDDNEYAIFLNYPDSIDFYVAPQIKIRKIKEQDVEKINYQKNPNGASYYEDKGNITFVGPFFVNVIPFLHEGNGYSNKIFTERVIKTFRFIK